MSGPWHPVKDLVWVLPTRRPATQRYASPADGLAFTRGPQSVPRGPLNYAALSKAVRIGDQVPYSLVLPPHLTKDGWTAKIQDRERLEPPHATVRRRTFAWRWNLRTRAFMNAEPDPARVPADILDILTREHQALVAAWDERFPLNPVNGEP